MAKRAEDEVVEQYNEQQAEFPVVYQVEEQDGKKKFVGLAGKETFEITCSAGLTIETISGILQDSIADAYADKYRLEQEAKEKEAY